MTSVDFTIATASSPRFSFSSLSASLVITAVSPRPIRFVMHQRIFEKPLLNFIFREYRTIPIASAKEDAAVMEKAFEEVAKALDAGELVCIFPEGRLTDTGDINPFRPGVRRILERNPVPVVPLATMLAATLPGASWT